MPYLTNCFGGAVVMHGEEKHKRCVALTHQPPFDSDWQLIGASLSCIGPFVSRENGAFNQLNGLCCATENVCSELASVLSCCQ